MASKEVLNALEKLHQELEKLEPAIKHVEAAEQVTKIVKAIPQKHIELLKEVKDNDAKYKGELKDLFTKEITGITEENKKLAKNTREIQQQVKAEQESLSNLKDKVQAFHESIEGINFPEKLDKLDANVAGIMAAIQSVQSRLDIIERNITDRLKDLSDYQKETRAGQQTNTYITWALIVIGVIAIILICK